MDLRIKSFPFMVKAESKTSQSGNDYLSIGLAQSKKLQQPDSQGNNYETIWMNFIDKRDLLVMANLCQQAYSRIVAEETRERDSAQPQQQAPQPKPVAQQPAETFDDDIPF